MSDMKKLFKHDCKYYFFAFIAIASSTTFFYQISIKTYITETLNTFYSVPEISDVWTKDRVSCYLANVFNDFSMVMFGGIYWFSFYMMIAVCLIYLGKSIPKTGRGTREFVASLPVKKNNRIIFEIANTSIVVMGSYIVFFINMIPMWDKIVKLKVLTEYNLKLFDQLEVTLKLMLIACASTILFITFLGLLDTVISNGMLAIIIAFADYIYYSWLTNLFFYLDDNSLFYLTIQSIKIGISGDPYGFLYAISPQHYFNPAGVSNWRVLSVVLILGLISCLLVLLAINITKMIDYAKGGLFYVNIFRYIHLGLIVLLYGIGLVFVMIGGLKWYSIVCFTIITIGVIYGLNYLITPRKVKN